MAVRPAHDGPWQAARDAGHSLIARTAIVPLVLEARGPDVTPVMAGKAQAAGGPETAATLTAIHNDEKRHVAFAAEWFRFLCAREGKPPEPGFHRLVRKHFKERLKPPFNDKARSEAGVTPGFCEPLCGLYG